MRTIIAIVGLAATAAGSAAVGQGSGAPAPAASFSDSWLFWAAVIGLFTGVVAHRAAAQETTAGALRFSAVGAVGGISGALLALNLVGGSYMAPGKFMSAVVLGAVTGAWVLAYVLRMLHPATKG